MIPFIFLGLAIPLLFLLKLIRRRIIRVRKDKRSWVLKVQRAEYLKEYKSAQNAPSDNAYVLSLTSVPNRYLSLNQVIDSLLSQTNPPQEIHLNLAKSDMSALPESTKVYLDSQGVKVFAVDDWGPAKKLIPTLERTDLPVICVDDDLIYEPTLTEHLLIQHKSYPKSVIASRTHKVIKNRDGNISQYKKWQKQFAESDGPAADLFATSGAGTLFKKEFLHPDAFDLDKYKKLAFYCDDLWWYFQARRVGVDVRRIPGAWPLNFVPGTQETGLWNSGNKARNEIILQDLLNLYGNPF